MALQVTGWWADPRATATLDIDPEFAAIVANSHGVHSTAARVAPTFAAHLGHVTKFTAAATITPQALTAELARGLSGSLTVTPTFSVGLQNFHLVSHTTVTPTFSAALENSNRSVGAHLTVAVAHSATLSIQISASQTTRPTFATNLKFPKLTATKTVTPTFAAGLHYDAYAHAAQTVAPVFVASLERNIVASKTVTPVFATAFTHVTAGVTAAKTVTPTFAATIEHRTGAALTVTPQFSAALHSHAAVAKTVTPTFTPALTADVHAAKTVTPTFSAALRRSLTAAKTVTPTFAASPKGNVTASKTVTPMQAAALGLQAISFDAIGSSYDSTGTTSTATLTHSATAGAYVFAFIATSNPNTPSAVQYGSAYMTLLGSVEDTLGDVWHYLYGLADAPSGSTTISIYLRGGAAYVTAQSISLLNVASVSSITSQTYDETVTSYSLAATSSTGQWILQSFANLQGGGITGYSGGTGQALIDYGGTSGEGVLTISTATTSTTFTATISSTATSDDIANGSGMYVVLTATS